MLKGTLDCFTLPEILQFLASQRKTGCVEVSRSAGDGRVFFREGEVYYGESSLTRGLDQAPDEAVARRQIEDAFFDLLRWELGEFTFSPGVEVDPGVAVEVSVETLIQETSQKLEELAVISTKIPNEHAVLAMASSPPSDSEINITSDEWRVLVLVSGNRSVAEIADRVGQDSFTVMRTLYGLAATGLIELVAVVEPAEIPEASEVTEAPNPAPSEAYLESLATPLEGAALAEQLDAEFPAFFDESTDAVESDDIDVGATAEPVTHEDQPGSLADLEGAEAAPEPAEIPIEEAIPAVVDRLAAVKELADLFDQPQDDAVGTPYPAELAARKLEAAAVAGDGRRRVEDDEAITRGLISRLIDGVKGL